MLSLLSHLWGCTTNICVTDTLRHISYRDLISSNLLIWSLSALWNKPAQHASGLAYICSNSTAEQFRSCFWENWRNWSFLQSFQQHCSVITYNSSPSSLLATLQAFVHIAHTWSRLPFTLSFFLRCLQMPCCPHLLFSTPFQSYFHLKTGCDLPFLISFSTEWQYH